MGAFRSVIFVGALAVGCGGQTNGANPGAASGTDALGDGTGASGSGGGEADVTSGATTAAPTEASVDLSDDGGDAQAGTACPPTVPPTVWNETPGGACTGNLQCFYDTDGGLLPEYTPCAYRVGECMPNGQWSSYHTDPGSTSFGVVCGGIDASLISAPSPSCAPGGPGMTNCGPGGSGTESCCTSLEVTGGTYYRTYTNAGGGPTGEADPATVTSFRLDKYLVTVGRFRQFVSAWSAGWRPVAGAGKHTHLNGGTGLVNVADDVGVSYEPGWLASDAGAAVPTDPNLSSCAPYSTWTPSPGIGNTENLPINCVTWSESYAFCIWDGGFLPSEAEWAYAAAGGSQQLTYPWGTAVPGTDNQHAILGCNYPGGSGAGVCSGVLNIAPVGTASLGAGLWGQLDLVGDVLEWDLDWYAPYRDPCIDCANLTPTSTRVDRGADYYGGQSFLAPPDRLYGGVPLPRGAGIGLRCARTP